MAQGDLSERARERARELACDFDLRVRAPRTLPQPLDAVNENAHVADRDYRLPPIGTELSREYNGQVIRVKVLGDGFEHNGRWHSSLSAVASRATGTRWNGFSFFGLNRRQAANE
jgi:hypothetical protein